MLFQSIMQPPADRRNPACTAWPVSTLELCTLSCDFSVVQTGSSDAPQPSFLQLPGCSEGWRTAGCQELLGDPYGAGRAAPSSPRDVRAAQEPLPMASSSKGQPPAAPARGWPWAPAPNLQEGEWCSQGLARACGAVLHCQQLRELGRKSEELQKDLT